MTAIIRVAVGVVWNPQGEVLIAWRDPKRDQGGCWEFPGGKVEADESVAQALSRELAEEVGLTICPSQVKPWLEITHDYGDKVVHLCVCQVADITETAQGLEGQALRWVNVETAQSLPYPQANQRILQQLQWPLSLST